jgi:hypothetical protein
MDQVLTKPVTVKIKELDLVIDSWMPEYCR